MFEFEGRLKRRFISFLVLIKICSHKIYGMFLVFLEERTLSLNNLFSNSRPVSMTQYFNLPSSLVEMCLCFVM